MAYANNLSNRAFEANADLSSFKYRVVELLSTGKVDLADLGKGYGVLQNVPKSGEMATVAVEGESKAIAGGTLAIADWVRATSGGWVVKANSGDLPGVMIMGQCLVTAASGAITTIDVRPHVLANVVSGSIAQALP
jgi:hypothetical protein